MAKFGVVMHDWSRMCKHFWSGDPTVECSEECPLNEVWCPMMNEPVMDAGEFDAEKLESVVTKWAAEHPEPVYPLWGEWLTSIGAARRVPTGIPVQLANGDIVDPPYDIEVNLYDHIPADIAEKLGIEPKDVI